MTINPADTYVLLRADGSSEQMPGGEAFWSKSEAELDASGKAWLVSEFQFNSDWNNWEMHPQGDEMVYLLEGEVVLLLELPTGLQSHSVKAPGALVVPKGIWHTAKTRTPCRMLHVTWGEGTESRPVLSD